MRRSLQALPQTQALEILNRACYGILGLTDAEGKPYTVPLHFALDGGHLYFHCAQAGYKLDCIRQNAFVSVSAVAQSDVIPRLAATNYRSATVRGRARIVTDESEKRRLLTLLLQKFCAGFIEEGQREIESSLQRTCIVEITPEDITGKQAAPFVREAAEKSQDV